MAQHAATYLALGNHEWLSRDLTRQAAQGLERRHFGDGAQQADCPQPACGRREEGGRRRPHIHQRFLVTPLAAVLEVIDLFVNGPRAQIFPPSMAIGAATGVKAGKKEATAATPVTVATTGSNTFSSKVNLRASTSWQATQIHPKYRAKPRTLEAIAKALEARERLIPADLEIPQLDTWFGTVRLTRLNDVSAYLSEPHPYLALMTDLWVAHSLRLVPMDLKTKRSFNQPSVIQRLIKTQLKTANRSATNIQVSWHDALVLNHALDNLGTIEQYRFTDGLIRFVVELADRGLIKSTHREKIASAICCGFDYLDDAMQCDRILKAWRRSGAIP